MATKLDQTVIYISDKFASFSMRVGKKRYKFIKHELHITTEEEEKAIDDILEEVPALKTKFHKVDKKGAEEFVKGLLNKTGPRHSAVKGPVSAQDILHSQTPLEQRDAELSALQPDQLNTLTDEMAKDNDFIMTEKDKNPMTDSVVNTEKPKPAGLLNLGLKENK